MKLAEEQVGPERTIALAKALSALTDKNAVRFHKQIVEAVIKADLNNVTGAREKYGPLLSHSEDARTASSTPKVMEILRSLPAKVSETEVLAAIDNFLKTQPLSLYDQQFAIMRKFLLHKRANRKEEAIKCLEAAITLDPTSKISENARNFLKELRQ